MQPLIQYKEVKTYRKSMETQADDVGNRPNNTSKMVATLPKGTPTEPSVLIVDDEEKLGRFICMLLKRSGYKPFSCRSVAEARNLLSKRKWAMVLTDIVMPKENGFELVQWIGKNYPSLPVVVMTAHSTEAIETQANKLGVAAILHKPFSIDGLRQIIDETAHLED